MAVDTFPLAAGSALPIAVSLQDRHGRPVQSYDGTEPLEAEVWPGGSRARSFLVSAAWDDARAGRVALVVAGEQTLGLPSGRYHGRLVAFHPIYGPEEVYQFAVDLRAVPGTAAEPPSYCRYEDLLPYARGWLPQLAGDDGEAGFAPERGRARSWLDDLILARYPRRGYLLSLGSPGYAQFEVAGGFNTPSVYVRALLGAELLIRRDWVVECTAKKALALVCDGQIGPGADAKQYVDLAGRYHNQALAVALCNAAEIGNPAAGLAPGDPLPPGGSGVTAFSIALGGGSLR